jgi:hypothetical protein
MERPIGVTVLACLYLLMAFAVLDALIPSQTFNPLRSTRFLALSTGNLITGIVLGIALFRMKSWSRWLAIIASVVQLLFVPHEIAVAQGSISIIRTGLRTLLFVWAIWYLTRPHVKTAFKSA